MNEAQGLREHISIVRPKPCDFDYSRQLNNAVFVQFLETGRWDWALANGIDLRESRLIGVVARLEIDYVRPLPWDPAATVCVRTNLDRLERYSLYLKQDVEDASGAVLARACLRIALYDPQTRMPSKIDLDVLRRQPADAA